jgi:hypothetical protein
MISDHAMNTPLDEISAEEVSEIITDLRKELTDMILRAAAEGILRGKVRPQVFLRTHESDTPMVVDYVRGGPSPVIYVRAK